VIVQEDTVFFDGMTLKNVRDAVAAAAMTGMWHIAYELATRYRLQDVICMQCGVITNAQNHTYVMHGQHAIRKCFTCNSGTRR